MSKFCGVISNAQPQNISEHAPLEFLNLDALANCLIKETEELHSDYTTKCEFVQEQQKALLENEQNLIEIHDNMKALNATILATEKEMQQNDCTLLQLEKNVKTLECINEWQTSIEPNCQLRNQKLPLSEYQSTLQMVKQLDNKMIQFSTLMQDCAELQQFSQLQCNPYRIIFAVLDYHVSVLEQTDTNLDRLMDKSQIVDEAVLQIMDKIAGLQQSNTSSC